MHKQPSGAAGDIEITRVHWKHTDNRQIGNHIHRQPNDSRLSPKQQYTHIPHRKNKTESDGVGTDRMENPFLLGQGTHRDPRKRTCRHPSKGRSIETGHCRMLQQGPEKCSETWTRRQKCRQVAKRLEPIYQGYNHKKLFSDSCQKTENENNDHPQLHNHGYGIWEHKVLFVLF
jgi:hypothetical protein